MENFYPQQEHLEGSTRNYAHLFLFTFTRDSLLNVLLAEILLSSLYSVRGSASDSDVLDGRKRKHDGNDLLLRALK